MVKAFFGPALICLSLLFSCADDEKLFHAVVSEVKASSFVVESVLAYGRYHPLMALDGDPATAWNEAAKGPGLGGWIEIAFDKPVTADAIKLMPGYFDAQWYQKNNRIKSLEIMLDGQMMQAELTDGMDEKTVALGKEMTFSKIRLTIRDIYKGSAYDDTCLSEIAFSLHKRKIELTTDAPRMQMDKEDGTAQIESMYSPMGKEISWYAMMGIGSSISFNPDYTYMEIPEFAERTTFIGRWGIDKDGRIKVTNFYKCELVGKGKVREEPTGGGYYYGEYEYIFKKIPDNEWQSVMGHETWKDYIKWTRENPQSGLIPHKINNATYELYKMNPVQREQFIINTVKLMVETKPQVIIDRLIAKYHSLDEFYRQHPDL